jgi:hypothetical protein
LLLRCNTTRSDSNTHETPPLSCGRINFADTSPSLEPRTALKTGVSYYSNDGGT